MEGGQFTGVFSRYWYNATMNPTAESTAFDRAVNPVLRQVLPDAKAQAVVTFVVDPNLRERIEELATKSTDDTLTEQERLEYQGYVRANRFIATLQRQARRILNPVL